MYIYHHLGLGDHLICNGLVRHFAENTAVTLLTKYNNFLNVKYMYQDNLNIHIIPITEDKEASDICGECLRCGSAINGKKYNNYLWDEIFYLDADIPFEYSWIKFNLYRNKTVEQNTYDKLTNSRPYAFIHNAGSDGVDGINYTSIDSKLTLIKSDPSINLFAYQKILENAKEIHCINSSFIHLIDRMDLHSNIKLFYHKNFRLKPFSDFTLKKKWNII